MKYIVFLLTFLFSTITMFADKKSPQWMSYGDTKYDKNGVVSLGKSAVAILNPDSCGGDFQDFELSLCVSSKDKGKGFLRFHTDLNRSKGYAVAIDNDSENPIWWRKTGSLVSVRNLTKSIVPDNRWFKLRLRVVGNLIEIYVNDEKVVEYAEPKNPYRLPNLTNVRLGKGTFSLECNTGTINFRNLKIKRLKNSDKNYSAESETADSVIALHQADFPVLDYHVHLKGDLTAEKAIAQARKYGINYAIAANCGKDFPINKDSLVLDFLKQNRPYPYILAMQAEGREWHKIISKKVRNEFDYVFTDAMTFSDNEGRRVHLWKPHEVFITSENEQAYMDMIVDRICTTVQEDANIYANATYLPTAIMPRYSEFWTQSRRAKVLDALQKGGMAFEISARYNIPDAQFIKDAKKRGIKFTFGSNNADSNFGKLEYCIKMIKECGLTPADMYKPNVKIEKGLFKELDNEKSQFQMGQKK